MQTSLQRVARLPRYASIPERSDRWVAERAECAPGAVRAMASLRRRTRARPTVCVPVVSRSVWPGLWRRRPNPIRRLRIQRQLAVRLLGVWRERGLIEDGRGFIVVHDLGELEAAVVMRRAD